jgi:glycosyltransferase involved in cell wall biosynthesis
MEGRAMRCAVPGRARLPLLRGYAYQTVVHNWLLRHALKGYDLIVNSNDFVGFLPPTVRRLHYFHFPLRASFSVMSRYDHRALRLATSPARWVANRFDGDILAGDVVFANSRFTRDRVRQLWPNANVDVLYPPVDVPPAIAPGERDIDVVTLGNIAPDKHQLEQLDLAAAMPEYRFAIIGAVQSATYARRLRSAIRSKGLTNVALVLDATARQVSDYLARGRVFVHMKESEHFGISVAQAVAHGCVPIVHDSGGQVEIVTEPALRFRAREEIPGIVRDVFAGRVPEPGYVQEIRARVRELAPGYFRSRIQAALT